MHLDDVDETADEYQVSGDKRSRRGFLKGAAATGTVVAGLSAASIPASAQWFGGDGGGIQEFDIGSNGADSFPNRDAEELLVWLHGLGGGSTTGFQAGQFQGNLADAGYDGTVIAGSYNSGSVGGGIVTGSSPPAEALAELVQDYYDNTDGSLRLVGHSMGGYLTMQTILQVDDSYTVDTAATLGSGTPANVVCENGTYGDAIDSNTEDFRVYASDNDALIAALGGADPGCDGGLGGGTPDNYTGVDVTDDVGSHIGYWSSAAVAEDLVTSLGDTGGDTGGDDSSEDDSSSGWWG